MEKEDSLMDLGEDLRNIEKEFKRKIEPYRSDLWKFCLKLTQSPWDAEDLVQETLLKSLSMLTKVFQEMNTKSYLFRIATNLWIDQHRKKRMEIQDAYPLETVQDSSRSSDFEVLESIEWMANSLTPKQYVTVLLTEVFQYTANEAGRIMGTSTGAVQANLQRARDALKNYTIDVPEKRITGKPYDIKSYSLTIEKLLEGFRKKDPTIIASLLDENVVTEITHAGIEYGKDETLKNSLNDWTELVQGQGEIVVYYKMLWGRPVVVELEVKADGYYLNNLHYIEEEDGQIVYWKFYCFSWDLINLAAMELDVKLNAKYFQHIF